MLHFECTSRVPTFFLNFLAFKHSNRRDSILKVQLLQQEMQILFALSLQQCNILDLSLFDYSAKLETSADARYVPVCITHWHSSGKSVIMAIKQFNGKSQNSTPCHTKTQCWE